MADPEESTGADDDIALGDITEQTNSSRNGDEDPEAVLASFRKEWQRELERSRSKNKQKPSGRSSPAGGATQGPAVRPHTTSKPPRPQRPITPGHGISGFIHGTLGKINESEEGGGDGEGGGGANGGVAVRESSGGKNVGNVGDNIGKGLTNAESDNTRNDKGGIAEEITADVELKAIEVWNKAVELEQEGCLYEAIQFYRRAMTLVPDIEFRAHRHNVRNRTEGIQNTRTEIEQEEDNNEGDLDEESIQDLTTRFQLLMAPAQAMCSPEFEQKAPHISCLPPEMLDRIMRWVVGSDLDLRSLEQVSSVCKGFYLMARNPEIWHKACLKIWGDNTGGPDVFGSWRAMFIHRPHPRFNGCYISRTTYFRCGASNFQDKNYQPWHLVQYYRYIRFFPDGVVTMLTTPDAPIKIVSHLRTKEAHKSLALVRGVYRYNGHNVCLLLKRQSKEMNNRRKGRRHIGGTTDVAETTFHIEFEIKPVKRRTHWHLVWQNYSITSTFYDGRQSVSQIEVGNTDTFPPLAFSRVKSYTGESERPLE